LHADTETTQREADSVPRRANRKVEQVECAAKAKEEAERIQDNPIAPATIIGAARATLLLVLDPDASHSLYKPSLWRYDEVSACDG